MLLVLDTGAEFLKTMMYVTVRTLNYVTVRTLNYLPWKRMGRRDTDMATGGKDVNLLTTAKYNIM